MLSSSIEATAGEVDLIAITDRSRDPLIPGGTALLDYVDAILLGGDITRTRDAVVNQLGVDGAVDATAVTGNFEMMNRIADGVGMPVGAGSRHRYGQLIIDLGLDRFPHA